MTDYSELVGRLNSGMQRISHEAATAIEALQAALTQRHTDDINDFAALCVDRDSYRDRCKGLEQERDHWKARAERLGQALAFAASAIKSGEPWTPECEKTIGRALNHQEGEQ